MARSWLGRLWDWATASESSGSETLELELLREEFRNLVPHLNMVLIHLRSLSIRDELEVKSFYSKMKASGKLQHPQTQELLRKRIESWREKELLLYACALGVESFNKAVIEAIDIKREMAEAIRWGLTPPQLSGEQEKLLSKVPNPEELNRQILSSAEKAVREKSLDEYVRRLNYSEMPAELDLLLHRSYESYLDVIETLLAKDSEEAKREQEKESRPAPASQQSWVMQQATLASPKQASSREKEGGVDVKAMEAPKPRVFLIHGHDPLVLRSAEALLLRIGCQPVIFSRIPNRATKTNIEVLEKHLPSCEAVVVLLTPDDEGRKRGTETLELRARQNVLVEAGFAVISRRATSLIVALGDVSIPSDLDGINRIQATAWDRSTELDLARELSSLLQLPVDLFHL